MIHTKHSAVIGW